MSFPMLRKPRLLLFAGLVVALSLVASEWVAGPQSASAYPSCSCTGYAWSKRQDLPQDLGNAKDWARNAAAKGWPVNGTPKVGDIAVFPPGVQGAHSTLGHVAYVEAVNSATSYRVSEMNFPTPCVVTTRTASTSGGVQFIHGKIPPVIVDDTSDRFTRYGPGQYWLQYGIGYKNHMYATWNNGPCSLGSGICPQGKDVNYAVWRPSIPSTRNYRVCAYIPPDHAYTTSARYKIYYDGGSTTVTVNQQPLIGWKSLGVYRFKAGTSGYVRLGDWTAEPFATRQIGFDAVEWVPDGGSCG